MNVAQLPSLSREDLITAAINGDRESLLTLLEIAQHDIRRLARRQCRSSMDADDAVQETLLLLYQRVGMLRMPLALPGWLNTIVRRACMRLARTANLAKSEQIVDEARLVERPTPEVRMDIAEAIQSLPLQYREIVVLRDVQEFTIDEICDALGLTREAVKGRLHRARLLLREYLLK
jgi:RNA polymerase sigma-70 factor (ECF subfamily)